MSDQTTGRWLDAADVDDLIRDACDAIVAYEGIGGACEIVCKLREDVRALRPASDARQAALEAGEAEVARLREALGLVRTADYEARLRIIDAALGTRELARLAASGDQA